jgi:hypothetical protein
MFKAKRNLHLTPAVCVVFCTGLLQGCCCCVLALCRLCGTCCDHRCQHAASWQQAQLFVCTVFSVLLL